MGYRFNPLTGQFDLVGSGSGTGDVTGPASSADNAIARYDGTTGKIIQDSLVYIDDTGKTGVGTPSPDYLLDVYSSSPNTETIPFRIKNNATAPSTGSIVSMGFTLSTTSALVTAKISHYNANAGVDRGLAFSVYNNGTLIEGMRLTGAGLLGIGTTAPTHSLTLPSTSTGIAQYNTVDQTTNYERGLLAWSSNVFTLSTGLGGTGAARSLNLTANSVVFTIAPAGSASGLYRFGNGSSGVGANGVVIAGNWTASSGVNNILSVSPTITQTATAGYTALLVNPTEAGTGSGSKLLADFQVGGTSKVNIDNGGVLRTIPVIAGLSGSFSSMVNNPTYNLASDDGLGWYGLSFSNEPAYFSAINKLAVGSFLGGMYVNPRITSTGGTNAKGVDANFTVSAGATVPTWKAFHARTPSVSSGTLSQGYGVYIDPQKGTNITAGYGIYFASAVAGNNAGSDINWSGDTNLYRGAANQLKTDDVLFAASLMTSVKTITATSNALSALDSTVLFDTTSNNVTGTLPTAVGIAGNIFTLKRTTAGANTATVDTTSSQTIDGSTTYLMVTQYKYVTVQSDGANWQIIGNN